MCSIMVVNVTWHDVIHIDCYHTFKLRERSQRTTADLVCTHAGWLLVKENISLLVEPAHRGASPVQHALLSLCANSLIPNVHIRVTQGFSPKGGIVAGNWKKIVNRKTLMAQLNFDFDLCRQPSVWNTLQGRFKFKAYALYSYSNPPSRPWL